MEPIRDRIIDFRRIKARELVPHPANWRRHPPAQREALRAMLEEIGVRRRALPARSPRREAHDAFLWIVCDQAGFVMRYPGEQARPLD